MLRWWVGKTILNKKLDLAPIHTLCSKETTLNSPYTPRQASHKNLAPLCPNVASISDRYHNTYLSSSETTTDQP